MLKTCFAMTLGLLAAATFLGCGETPQATGAGQPAGGTTSAPALTDAQIQSLAEKQKVCPVSGEPLGSMGSPQPVSVIDSKGGTHTVLICCESCREPLTEKPDGYLAKLEEGTQE